MNEAEQYMKPLEIIYAVSGDYFAAFIASANSVQQNTNRPLRFHVITDSAKVEELQDAIQHQLPLLHPLEIVVFNDARIQPLIRVWGNERGAVYYNTINYARFYLPEIFPLLEEAIYLDPDTIVTADIGELFDIFTVARRNNDSNYFFATPSRTTKDHPKSFICFLVNCKDPAVARVVTKDEKFFNAGVFVTDLSLWRKHNITSQLEYWLWENSKRNIYIWGSQAPLSLAFYNRWSALPFDWNERRARKRYLQNRPISAKLYHFTSDFKPWTGNGEGIWHLWCPYYPLRAQLWFCEQDPHKRFRRLFPTTPLDYSFILSFHFA